MKPLSNDLRERLVHAVLIEGMTCRAAGKRFAVSHSAVIKIVRQFVETDVVRGCGYGANCLSSLHARPAAN